MKVTTKVLAVTAFVMGLTTLQAKAQVELQVGHTLTPESHYQVYAQKFKEFVEEKSKGQIKVSIFGQGQLGGEVRMIQSMRSGALAIMVGATAPLENTVPEFSVFSAPFLFKDLDEANKVFQGPVGAHFQTYLPSRGLIGLGFISAIERDVYTSKKPIRRLQDFANLKIRVIQSPAYVDTYQALGAQPTPMAYSEVYLAMQNGVVDGAENSPDTMIMDRFVEVSKYFNMTRIQYLPAMAMMSKIRFDALSKEQQNIVLESSKAAVPFAIDAYKRTYNESMEKIKAAKVEIVEVDTTDMVKATRTVAEKIFKSAPDGEANAKKIQESVAKK